MHAYFANPTRFDMMEIDPIRIRPENDKPVNHRADYVLYWMTAFRRVKWNHALQRAVQAAKELDKPLLVFEPLRTGYRWSCDRFHQFIIEGMHCNQQQSQNLPITYYPYVEPKPNASKGLLAALASRACCVIADDYPCFFLPSMVRHVRRQIPTRFELVDSNSILPMNLADRTFTVAHSYRRWMQKNVLDYVDQPPLENPTANTTLPSLNPNLIAKTIERWPSADLDSLLTRGGLDSLPINHDVVPSTEMIGGSSEAENRLQTFIDSKLARYDSDRNHPDFHATSRLSPYLHFGHLSAHQFVHAVLKHEKWSPEQTGIPNGKNHGFWNVSPSSEGVLDQIITWRELGFNFASRHPRDIDRYESLPSWARTSLEAHADDKRPYLYSMEEFEYAKTHDDAWNAAQSELVRTGTLHNYMRMLWGKKILHWSKSPREALKILIHLNNKYALDGRDPNSYSGIFWVLGRYDRAWGPKRPVFGSVRYMTSESAKKKLKMKSYLSRYTIPSEELHS